MEIKNTRLPEEIIEEILSRLAVKSVLRFRCVSKSWQSTIDSKRFIKKHMQNSTSCRVIMASEPAKLWQCSVVSISNKPEIHELELKFPAEIRSISFVGCCNGLVCVLLNSKEFILWNPSTRISKKLPPAAAYDDSRYGLRSSSYGFCYDECSGDYKVLYNVCINVEHDFSLIRLVKSRVCKVYSLKSDSWKDRDSRYFIGSIRCAGQGKVASGKLHWVCYHTPDIIAFDMSREIQGDSVKKPDFDEKGLLRRTLGKLGECLSLLCSYQNRFDVWVMKEYAVKESWQKLVKVDHQPFDYEPIDFRPYDCRRQLDSLCMTPLCIGPQGEITFMENGTFFTYYQDGWSKRMGKFNTSYQADIYFETLLQL